MRNGSQIIADSFKLHDGVIEKGTTISIAKDIKTKTVTHINSRETHGKQTAGTVISRDALKPSKELTSARVVVGGKNAVYKGPKEEATGCPTILGLKPKLLKGENGMKFIKEEVIQRCFTNNETMVRLGNDSSDLDWMVECLTDNLQPDDSDLLFV